jgi:hypothetical protein
MNLEKDQDLEIDIEKDQGHHPEGKEEEALEETHAHQETEMTQDLLKGTRKEEEIVEKEILIEDLEEETQGVLTRDKVAEGLRISHKTMKEKTMCQDQSVQEEEAETTSMRTDSQTTLDTQSQPKTTADHLINPTSNLKNVQPTTTRCLTKARILKAWSDLNMYFHLGKQLN